LLQYTINQSSSSLLLLAVVVHAISISVQVIACMHCTVQFHSQLSVN